MTSARQPEPGVSLMIPVHEATDLVDDLTQSALAALEAGQLHRSRRLRNLASVLSRAVGVATQMWGRRVRHHAGGRLISDTGTM